MTPTTQHRTHLRWSNLLGFLRAITHTPIIPYSALMNTIIFPYLDMPTLLTWRATCKKHYRSVSKELHHMRHRLLTPFTPDPSHLLTLLTRFGGLIVGEAALAYTLRDPTSPHDTLELAVGNVSFRQFTASLQSLLQSSSLFENLSITTPPPPVVALRHIATVAEVRLISGHCILIYESDTVTACSVVAGMWSSVLMNFVTPYTFACAYPRLTFNLRGLLSRPRLTALRVNEAQTWNQLQSHNFHLTFASSEWFPPEPYHDASSYPPRYECRRSLHMCSHQGRFFGDVGSLVVLIDVLSVSRMYLRAQYIAPYGPMAAWRIPNVEGCSNDCINKDGILPPGIVTILCSILESDRASYVRLPRKLRFSTASDRLPFTLPPLRRGERRYSVA